MWKESKNSLLFHPFLPQSLKKEKLYRANLLGVKKREAQLEFFSLNLSKEASYTDLLRMPENKVWNYGTSPSNSFSSYSFYYKNFDKMSKSFQFSMRKKKLNAMTVLNEKFFFKKEKNLLKARLLSVSSKDSKYSVNQNLGWMLQKKRKKDHFFQAPHRLVFYLSSYGYLKNLKRLLFQVIRKKFLKKKISKFSSKKLASYIKKNLRMKPLFCLKKRKKELLLSLIA